MTRRGAPLWLWYLGVGAAVMGTYFTVPTDDGGALLRVVLYVSVSASAAVAVFGGVSLHRPRHALPWLLIGAGQAVYAVADAIFYVNHYLRADVGYPSLADVFYLLHYPLITLGLLGLIRRRIPSQDTATLLDAAAVTVVGAMLSWVYLIAPQTEIAQPALVEITSLAYPVLDIAVLAVAGLFVLGSGRRSVAYLLVVGNLVALLTVDTIYVRQQLDGTYVTGNYLDALWLTGNLLLGASALHPAMPTVAERAEPAPDSLGLVRIAALCGAALIAPVTLWFQDLSGHPDHVSAIALACALLFLLTIARLVVLVLQQRQLAITDALTGLRTRRFLEAQLSLEVERAERYGGTVALFLIDVDHFKRVNDSYGHPAGDRVLVEIARRLERCSRGSDVVARYGGEEFAVVMPRARAAELDLLARRLRAAVGGSPIVPAEGSPIALTISIGAACFPTHAPSPTKLVEVADRSLYAAKAAGRDRAVIAHA